MKEIRFCIFVIVLLSFAACDVINPDEPIPAYIKLEDFNVSSGSSQGSADSKITDGYLYINNEFLGVYELSKTIPIIASGETDIFVDPGIKENGIAATPNIYPFFKRFSTSVNLEAGEVTTITPETSYNSEATFAYIEDFEITNSVDFDADGDSLNAAQIITTGAYEGRSIRFSVDEDVPRAEVATSEKFFLPTDGGLTYLELNYKNDAFLQVGLIGYQQSSGVPIKYVKITLNPRDTWNKIYINLTDDLIQSDLFNYQLLFIGNLPAGGASANFYLDNIKLIHE